MNKPIELEDNDLIRVDLLMTPNLYPLPAGAIILKNHGNTIVTSADGAVEAVGDHMELEIEGADFLQWTTTTLSTKGFWLRDSKTKKFVQVKVKIEMNGSD